MLRQLHNQISLPWLYTWNFNVIFYDDEKVGGALRPIRQIENFRQVLHDCNLNKVPFT